MKYPTRCFFVFLVVSLLSFSVAPPASASSEEVRMQSPSVFSARCETYEPFSVDISALLDFFETLSPDEKEEQLRDWAFYGLFASLGFTPWETDEIAGRGGRMRYASLREKQLLTVLPGRVALAGGGACVMLVTTGESDDKLFQGSLFDKLRAANGSSPKIVYVFCYSPDIASKNINISYLRTVPGEYFLSADYGYLEVEITGAETLKRFLRETNSLAAVKLKEKSVILGGRRNRAGDAGSLEFEDAAALHQAYIKYIPPGMETQRRKYYDIFLTKKYDEILKNDKRLRKAVRAGKIGYLQIMTKIKKVFPYVPEEDVEPNVGFSLDPLYDFVGISKDIHSLLERSGPFSAAGKDKELSGLIDADAGALSAAAARISSAGDIVPLLKFRRTFSARGSGAEKKLDSALQQIEYANTYQTARYDGRVRGTGLAMILFYTDLTAKLWALDYNGLAPRSGIAGFRALSTIKVPKLYWADFVKFSKTRLWFGLRQEGFEMNENDIIFAPVAARVYAASSDPLFPGRESTPNYQSREFLGWWDAHYAEVADYEPYYYKLNELLKWSCLMMVIREKRSHALDFLSEAPVRRSFNFEDWYRDAPGLRNRTELPFTNKAGFHGGAECFKMLSSAGYPLMGFTYFISGGVSLASSRDLRSKLSVHGVTAKRAKPLYVARPEKSQQGRTGPAAGPAAPVKANAWPGNDFGVLSAKVIGRTVKLEWHKGEGAVLDECVNSLAAAGGRVRGESVFSVLKDVEKVVRIEPGRIYLIKTRLLADKWIYLSVNPSGGVSEFPSKAAGTDPDSDIYCARTIKALLAEKLSLYKNGVTVFK